MRVEYPMVNERRRFPFFVVGFVFGIFFAAGVRLAVRQQQAEAAPRQGETGGLAVQGKTCPAPGRLASIAPQALQPVKKVLVAEGDTVKEGQVLVQLDDEDARLTVKQKRAKLQEAQASLNELKGRPHQAKVEQARAKLEKARAATREARKNLDIVTPLTRDGVVAAKKYNEMKGTYEKAQADEKAAEKAVEEVRNDPILQRIAEQEAHVREAEADLQAAEADREDYAIKAPLAGVVIRLDANPGLIARPGTVVWGEILDPSEIEVRCAVPPHQARTLAVGQQAEVRRDGHGPALARGRVVMVGVAADARTGLLPVRVRIDNRKARLPCHVPVSVVFSRGEPAGEGR